MSKTSLIALLTSVLLTTSFASFANETTTQPEVAATTPAPAAQVNSFDPMSWMSSMQQPQISNGVQFNAANPGAWMKMVDPKTHMSTHMMFANPASYTQFMQPQFFMEFTKPENMMAWMNPASYQVMMDPQTMAYWMNPNSFMHMANPAMYQQAMNPASYMAYMNPTTYTSLFQSGTCDSENPDQAPGFFGFGCQ